MLKDFAWNSFMMTGDINSYMFLKEIEDINNINTARIIAEEEAAISIKPS